MNADWIDHLARASGGDIRHAITSLQYVCLRPADAFPLRMSSLSESETSIDKHNSLSSLSFTGSEVLDTRPSLSIQFGRDETLTLFHALGKFLHNKRETADAHALGM